MRVIIADAEDGHDLPRVRFTGKIGDFWALWCNSSRPVRGKTGPMEIDCDDELRWGVDVVPDPGARHRIVTDGQHTQITGTLEGEPHVSSGLLPHVRVGPWLIDLDIVGEMPRGTAGTVLTVRVTTLKASPYDLDIWQGKARKFRYDW